MLPLIGRKASGRVNHPYLASPVPILPHAKSALFSMGFGVGVQGVLVGVKPSLNLFAMGRFIRPTLSVSLYPMRCMIRGIIFFFGHTLDHDFGRSFPAKYGQREEYPQNFVLHPHQPGSAGSQSSLRTASKALAMRLRNTWSC